VESAVVQFVAGLAEYGEVFRGVGAAVRSGDFVVNLQESGVITAGSLAFVAVFGKGLAAGFGWD